MNNTSITRADTQKYTHSKTTPEKKKILKLLNPSKFDNDRLPQTTENNITAYEILEDLEQQQHIILPEEILQQDIHYTTKNENHAAVENQFAAVLPKQETGQELNQYLENNEPLHWTEAQNIITNVAEGLSTLHQNNVIHHDVRPSNIFYNPENGETTLFDFDHSTTPYQQDLTIQRDFRLTYPPELLQGGQIDQTLDIFQLGATWIQLTHQLPRTEKLGETITKLNPENNINQGLNPEIPETHNQLMQQTIQFQKNQRPQNASQLLQKIQNLETKTTPTI